MARELPFLVHAASPFVFARRRRRCSIAGALICAVGVLDDLFELDALTKLGGQVLAAGFLVVSGHAVLLLPAARRRPVLARPGPGRRCSPSFVVVATVNAVNFVDGLDGLAAGVVGIGAVAFFVFCYQLADLNDVTLATTGALLSAALAGACAGLPAAQLPPGPAVHGRLRLDADRAGARRPARSR